MTPHIFFSQRKRITHKGGTSIYCTLFFFSGEYIIYSSLPQKQGGPFFITIAPRILHSKNRPSPSDNRLSHWITHQIWGERELSKREKKLEMGERSIESCIVWAREGETKTVSWSRERSDNTILAIGPSPENSDKRRKTPTVGCDCEITHSVRNLCFVGEIWFGFGFWLERAIFLFAYFFWGFYRVVVGPLLRFDSRILDGDSTGLIGITHRFLKAAWRFNSIYVSLERFDSVLDFDLKGLFFYSLIFLGDLIEL